MLPQAATSTAYDAVLAATGGTAPYTWSVLSGSLPGGFDAVRVRANHGHAYDQRKFHIHCAGERLWRTRAIRIKELYNFYRPERWHAAGHHGFAGEWTGRCCVYVPSHRRRWRSTLCMVRILRNASGRTGREQFLFNDQWDANGLRQLYIHSAGERLKRNAADGDEIVHRHNFLGSGSGLSHNGFAKRRPSQFKLRRYACRIRWDHAIHLVAQFRDFACGAYTCSLYGPNQWNAHSRRHLDLCRSGQGFLFATTDSYKVSHYNRDGRGHARNDLDQFCSLRPSGNGIFDDAGRERRYNAIHLERQFRRVAWRGDAFDWRNDFRHTHCVRLVQLHGEVTGLDDTDGADGVKIIHHYSRCRRHASNDLDLAEYPPGKWALHIRRR